MYVLILLYLILASNISTKSTVHINRERTNVEYGIPSFILHLFRL